MCQDILSNTEGLEHIAGLGFSYASSHRKVTRPYQRDKGIEKSVSITEHVTKEKEKAKWEGKGKQGKGEKRICQA